MCSSPQLYSHFKAVLFHIFFITLLQGDNLTRTGRPFVSASMLALVSLLGLYPAVLIVPIALHYATDNEKNDKNALHWTTFCSIIAVFFCIWAGALYAVVTLSGSWEFLQSTYMFLCVFYTSFSLIRRESVACSVLVPDLTPTVGVFWYFFTEVFDHFRLFFLWVFQLNIFIFVIPLTLTLRRVFSFLITDDSKPRL